MRILLITNYPNSAQQSMLRFAALMQARLREAGEDVRTSSPPVIFGRLWRSEYGVGKWLGYLDRYVVYIPLLRRAVKWADVVHICDHGNAMYLPWLRNGSHVITCHDLIAIRGALDKSFPTRPKWTGRVLQRWCARWLARARLIVCVSRHTATELQAVLNIPSERIHIVPNSLNHTYKPMPYREAVSRLSRLSVDVRRPFFLHVGGNQWYKNRAGVVRIFARLVKLREYQDHQLMLVGKPWTSALRKLVTECDVADRARELINVSNDDLCALYSTACALLFPSVYEGFGWPIIEAQACGCPVITTNRPPMTEVGGDAAIYIDPDDEEEAALLIARRLGREADVLVANGLANVRRFSEGAMIEGYLAAYSAARAAAPVLRTMGGSVTPRRESSSIDAAALTGRETRAMRRGEL